MGKRADWFFVLYKNDVYYYDNINYLRSYKRPNQSFINSNK